MQSVNKYNRKNRIGLGWTTGGAVLTILAAAIGLLLMLNNNRLGTMAPPASVSKVQPAAQDRTLAKIMGSGQYPFGATGFDSLLPSQPATARERTLAEIMGSGQYPFGATGFDSLLPSQPARTRPAGVMSGQYPFGATGFDSLLAGER